jgi:hypothetical protein
LIIELQCQSSDDRKLGLKSYINKYGIGHDWLAGITLLPVTSVDISLLKNYLRKEQAALVCSCGRARELYDRTHETHEI